MVYLLAVIPQQFRVMTQITRFAILPDERCLLLGLDKAEIFEKGVVYQVEKMLGEIIIKPIGKYSLPEAGSLSEQSLATDIIYSGMHLLTQDEVKTLL